GQRIDAGHAHAVQAARDLVRVLVELAAGVQLRHDDLGRAAVVFVVFVDGGGDAAAVVRDRNAVVGVDGDDDVVAIAGQCLVDGVVHDLGHHVVQASAVGGVADVHPRALAHGLEALEHLDRIGAVGVLGGLFWHVKPMIGIRSLGLGRTGQMRIGMTTYLNSSSSGRVSRAEALTSGWTDQRTVSTLTLPSTSSR